MIVPSIDIQQGRAVQLRRGREKVLDGGDPLDRLAEMAVAGEVAVVDLDAALGEGSNRELVREMVRRAPCRVGGGIRDVETARDWLDHGAAKIVLGTAARPEVLRELPRERIIAAVDTAQGAVVVNGWRTATGDDPIDLIRRLRPLVGGFLLTQVDHEGCLAGFDAGLVSRAVEAAGEARLTAAGGISTAAEIAELDRAGADAQIGMALYGGRLTLGEGVAAVLDRELPGELWPTVVCDEHGVALGLVWSCRRTVAMAVDERRGIYWSRSRGEVWVKGASSGHTQELLRVEVDCDRDALRFVVRQRGSFCHTGARSCWPGGFALGDLERTLRERAADSRNEATASGTARLLREPELLASKLAEEADELAAAEGTAAVAHEAADLIYFTLVAAVRGEVTLEEIERELAHRSLRVGRRPMIARREGRS
jgi:phosphoribosyl-ATP pyrophosphohydrolase